MSGDRIEWDNRDYVATEVVLDHDGIVLRKTEDLSGWARETEQLREIRSGIKSEMKLVANIPVTLWYEWIQKYGPNFHADQVLFRRLLNDPEYKYTRVEGGRV